MTNTFRCCCTELFKSLEGLHWKGRFIFWIYVSFWLDGYRGGLRPNVIIFLRSDPKTFFYLLCWSTLFTHAFFYLPFLLYTSLLWDSRQHTLLSPVDPPHLTPPPLCSPSQAAGSPGMLTKHNLLPRWRTAGINNYQICYLFQLVFVCHISAHISKFNIYKYCIYWYK